MFRHERDVLVAGWTNHEQGRRKEDDNPTLTGFRLDFGHEEKALKDSASNCHRHGLREWHLALPHRETEKRFPLTQGGISRDRRSNPAPVSKRWYAGTAGKQVNRYPDTGFH